MLITTATTTARPHAVTSASMQVHRRSQVKVRIISAAVRHMEVRQLCWRIRKIHITSNLALTAHMFAGTLSIMSCAWCLSDLCELQRARSPAMHSCSDRNPPMVHPPTHQPSTTTPLPHTRIASHKSHQGASSQQKRPGMSTQEPVSSLQKYQPQLSFKHDSKMNARHVSVCTIENGSACHVRQALVHCIV